MNDRGTYDGVPTRLKVADVIVNYGKDVSFTRSGLIKSPFRDERTPSFHILAGGYGWVDFGDGTKGGVIDLVMRLEHCDRTFAVRRLAEMRNGGRFFVPSGQQASRSACRQAPALKVVSSSYVSDGTLLRYASGRGIPEDVLRMYCREVAVRKGRSGSVQSYIGFSNNGDGYVLRSAESGPGGKRCTNSAPTYLAPDGMITAGSADWAVAVFEGFFDFLSFIERRRTAHGILPGCDICVMNSVANLKRSLDFILGHRRIDLFLDNDKAGRDTSEAIVKAAPGIDVMDHSGEYAGYGDLNEFHMKEPMKCTSSLIFTDMEQTQENKTAGKKEISYPKFIQERLDRIPWEELEASYGIRKDYILGNEQVARQLASGQVTDYVRCYAKVGNLTVIGPMALQANFRNDRVEVKHFTVNPNPDLSVYGDALRSDKVAERLMDTYEYTVKDDEGKAVRKETRHSFANGGSPITITRQNPDGSESKTRCLVSFDGFVRNRDGEIIRGTQKLFLTPCAEVQTYLEKVAPTMYGHEFTPEQREALSEGKDLYIEDFKTKDGKTFDAVVQYNAVLRQVVKVDTPFWRETVRKRNEASRTAAPEKRQETEQKKAPARKEEAQETAPKRARRV